MLVAAFGIGIVIGFIFFEVSGLTAGGIIVPGYLALYVNDPLIIIVTVLISTIVYAIVNILSNHLILFGKRRFFLIILIGFIIRSGVDYLNITIPEAGIELQVIGYIIPGLIANEFFKQGILKTLMSMIIVVTTVYFLINIIY